MIKNVLVSVSGIQFEIDEEEVIEVITTGNYYCKNGKHYILYDERDEQQGVTKNRIKIDKNRVEMRKQGAVTTNMIFEEGKENITYYNTGFGTLLVQVKTSSVTVLEREDFIYVKILYSMDVNYSHVSECKVEIKVRGNDISR
ncbi:MAG: DUF1934 domain-containing protein [Lachnospiraceae bacterium]